MVGQLLHVIYMPNEDSAFLKRDKEGKLVSTPDIQEAMKFYDPEDAEDVVLELFYASKEVIVGCDVIAVDRRLFGNNVSNIQGIPFLNFICDRCPFGLPNFRPYKSLEIGEIIVGSTYQAIVGYKVIAIEEGNAYLQYIY